MKTLSVFIAIIALLFLCLAAVYHIAKLTEPTVGTPIELVGDLRVIQMQDDKYIIQEFGLDLNWTKYLNQWEENTFDNYKEACETYQGIKNQREAKRKSRIIKRVVKCD